MVNGLAVIEYIVLLSNIHTHTQMDALVVTRGSVSFPRMLHHIEGTRDQSTDLPISREPELKRTETPLFFDHWFSQEKGTALCETMETEINVYMNRYCQCQKIPDKHGLQDQLMAQIWNISNRSCVNNAAESCQ